MIARLMLIVFLVSSNYAFAEIIQISRFSVDGLSGWEHKSFKGQTEYTLMVENGDTAVRAFSKSSASGLYKKVNIDPKRYRYLHWSWKVSGIVARGDEGSKVGDDYAARLYVVFPGRFFWQTKAINYIWANRLPVGKSIPNVFSGSTIMVAVESGSSKAGRWLDESRDILADYRHLFGEEPRLIGAIAIMTDTDNTGSEAEAWYGDISLSSPGIDALHR